MTLADRIVIMKDGHIQQVGTPGEVYHSPATAFVAQFIGAPSMNMLAGILSDSGVILASGQIIGTRQRSSASRKVMLGLRPDDLVPVDPDSALVQGTVTLREPLGAETLIYIDNHGQEIIAKADGRNPPELGARVVLGAELANLHVFDADTGSAVT